MKHKFPKPKKVSISRLKKKAWVVFSQYIRRSAADNNGMVHCYTCDFFGKWNKNIQAGHGIAGRNNTILFNEKLVKPQCMLCNFFKRGNYQVFTRKLIDEFGLKEYDRLVTESNKVMKFTPVQLEEIYQTYRGKLSALNI